MNEYNAFLYCDLEEEVYIKVPPEFQSSIPNQDCLLNKSLYGLHQAPRCWFSKLSSALKTYGFVQSYANYSLSTYFSHSTFLRDLIITGSDLHAISWFKNHLNSCFYMKDLGPLKYFLGIEVHRN